MPRWIFSLICALLLPTTVPAQVLYAVTGAGGANSALYTVNPASGAASFVGNIGFTHVTALAFDPTTGILYGHASTESMGGNQTLIIINPATGAGTLVGTTGEQVPDMTFTPGGVLFAWSEDDDNLYTINKVTGGDDVGRPLGNYHVTNWIGLSRF